jgi:ATP-dependent RNA circularization protein (DNA/RNA ligase family)
MKLKTNIKGRCAAEGAFRFPRTPHLAWLAHGKPRDDKVLTSEQANFFLAHDITVEEKIDGANLGFFIDADGELCAQNRGTILSPGLCAPQFKTLFRWLNPRKESLHEALYPDLMLFGEWCYAVHNVRYNRLPDWFLSFDVYDRKRNEFWSVLRRDALVQKLHIEAVPKLASGKFTIAQLKAMRAQSKISDFPAEGLYLRRDEDGRLVERAKLVWESFTQSITTHWSRKRLVVNSLAQLDTRDQERSISFTKTGG